MASVLILAFLLFNQPRGGTLPVLLLYTPPPSIILALFLPQQGAALIQGPGYLALDHDDVDWASPQYGVAGGVLRFDTTGSGYHTIVIVGEDEWYDVTMPFTTSDIRVDFSNPPELWANKPGEVSDVVKIRFNGIPCLLNSTNAAASAGYYRQFCQTSLDRWTAPSILSFETATSSSTTNVTVTASVDDLVDFGEDASIIAVSTSQGDAELAVDGNFYTYWETPRPNGSEPTMEMFFDKNTLVYLDQLKLEWGSDFYESPALYLLEARNSTDDVWQEIGRFDPRDHEEDYDNMRRRRLRTAVSDEAAAAKGAAGTGASAGRALEDGDAPALCSVSSCVELGWSDGVNGYTDGICTSASLACSGDLSFVAARDYCEAYGARLCTYNEVRAGQVTGAGCIYDNQFIWTQTPCATSNGADGYMTTYGSSSYEGDSCQYVTESSKARCCADAYSCAPTVAPRADPTPIPSATTSPTAPTPLPTYNGADTCSEFFLARHTRASGRLC